MLSISQLLIDIRSAYWSAYWPWSLGIKGDGRMDGRMDGQEFPHVLQDFVPFGSTAQKPLAE